MRDLLGGARYALACWCFGLVTRLEWPLGCWLEKEHRLKCERLRRRWNDRSPF
jgi:hypothetical protein